MLVVSVLLKGATFQTSHIWVMEQLQDLNGASSWHLRLAAVEQTVSALKSASAGPHLFKSSDKSITSNLNVVPISTQVTEARARLQSLHEELHIIDIHLA